MEKEDKLTKPQGWGAEPVFNGLESQSGSLAEIGDDGKIYDLVDVIEEYSDEALTDDVVEEEEEIRKDESMTDDAREEEIRKNVSEIAERIAREMFPQIAERLIREEIGKLKEKVEE